MLQLQELISKLFNLVVEDEDLKRKKLQPLEQMKSLYDVVQNKLNDYKSLEKQLQKFEGEVRKHIRDEYVMKQKIEEMHQRIEEQENSREELLLNTKNLINKLKRENEELYQKNKQLMQELDGQKDLNLKLYSYQEKIKALESLTQQSTKISNSKYTTLDNTSIFVGTKKISSKSRITTNVTPQRTRQDMDQSFKNSTKRFSQQYLQSSYMNNSRKQSNKNKYISSKRQSMIANNSQSLDITKSM